MISTAFAPLAHVVGEGIGHVSLPIVVVPHPVGDRDEKLIEERGAQIAAECARLLTTPADVLSDELRDKDFPLPRGVMPR